MDIQPKSRRVCLIVAAVVFLGSGALDAATASAAAAGYPAAPAAASLVAAPQVQNAAFGWGAGAAGLGTGSTDDSAVPTQVIPYSGLAGKRITALSTNENQTCAIASGRVVCWGTNPLPLDQGGPVSGLTPTAISVGEAHACGIFSGSAFCWGSNQYGGLGTNSTVDSETPVPVWTGGVLAGKTIQAISAGRLTTCALAEGRAYCWGFGGEGQLGNGGTPDKYSAYANSSVPVAVDASGALAGKTLTSIGTGGTGSCALASGEVYCWGEGEQLGSDAHTANSPVPVPVDNSGVLHGKTVTDLSVGASTVCVVADGKPYCWGANGDGGLGGGPNGINDESVYSPVAVLATGALAGKTVTDLSVGAGHSCVLASGAVYCWGGNFSGEMGIGGFGGKFFPPEPVDTAGGLAGRTITSIAVGWRQAYAVTAESPSPVVVPGAFVPIAASRVSDTRPGVIAANGSVAVQMLGRGGVPTAGVAAVVVNVTALASADGYFSVGPDGSTEPATSTLNFASHAVVANLAVVPVGGNGKIRIYNHAPRGDAALVDVVGYYVAGVATAPGAYVPITPSRVVDTRPAGIMGLTGVYIDLAGTHGIPFDGTSAISGNLTAVSTQVAGSLSITPAGQSAPTNLYSVSFGVPQIAANMVMVPTDDTRRVDIVSHPANNKDTNRTSAILDVSGYFLAGDPYAPGTFSSLQPTSVLSGAAGAITGGGSTTLQTTGVAGVPATGIAAVVVHLTVVATTRPGYLSTTPDGASRPTTSTLNFIAGQTVSNLAIVPVGLDGKIRLYNYSSSTIKTQVTVTGYYRTGGL